jgi:hypothetical protein
MVQSVHIERRESALTESVSVTKLKRDSMKLSLCKECKETGARPAQWSARIQTLRKDLVQGLHRYQIRISVKGTLQKSKN